MHWENNAGTEDLLHRDSIGCDCRFDLRIGGVQPATAIDFPGRLSAVLFCAGCPWNCAYCHNAGLRDSSAGAVLSWETVGKFLLDRVGFLDGIVVSGGEPTMHEGLPQLLFWLKSLGYATAIHTNGYNPVMLNRVLRACLVDYVAMDIKATPARYDSITGVPNSSIAASRSIRAILSSGIEYEFRTTWHPSLLSVAELRDTMRAVASVGAKRYYLQTFQPKGVADPGLVSTGTGVQFPADIVAEAEKSFPEFAVR